MRHVTLKLVDRFKSISIPVRTLQQRIHQPLRWSNWVRSWLTVHCTHLRGWIGHGGTPLYAARGHGGSNYFNLFRVRNYVPFRGPNSTRGRTAVQGLLSVLGSARPDSNQKTNLIDGPWVSRDWFVSGRTVARWRAVSFRCRYQAGCDHRGESQRCAW